MIWTIILTFVGTTIFWICFIPFFMLFGTSSMVERKNEEGLKKEKPSKVIIRWILMIILIVEYLILLAWAIAEPIAGVIK